MSESVSLRDVVNDAISDWCRGEDFSMVTNFVLVAEFMENDGAPSHAVVTPEQASVSASLGLALYAQNLLSEIQRRDVLSTLYDDCGDGDE